MATAAASWVQKPKRILVASPDPRIRARLLNCPGNGEIIRTEACGGAQALAKLKEMDCDGVLLDRNLADLDSAEVAESIRRDYPNVEVSWIEEEGPPESSVIATSMPIPSDSAALRNVLRWAQRRRRAQYNHCKE